MIRGAAIATPFQLNGIRPTNFEFNAAAAKPLQFGFYATLFVHGTGGVPPELCGGVVISPQWVLTAAHCVGRGVEAVTVYPASTGAGWWPDPGQFASSTIVSSPTYEPSATDAAQDDIGLVHLQTPIPNAVVATLDLSGDKWRALPEGAQLLSAGHGLTCNGGAECVSRTLMVATIPKVSTSRCEADTSDVWSSDIVGGSICAGFIGVEKAPQPCQGDSGGPLFDRSGVVYALVSRGDASLGCGNSRRPTLFAPVSRAIKFLKSEVFAPPPALGSRDVTVGPLSVTVGAPIGSPIGAPIGAPVPQQQSEARSAASPPSPPAAKSAASRGAVRSAIYLAAIALCACRL